MKSIVAGFAGVLITLSVVSVAKADGAPQYIKDTFPEHAMTEILKSWGTMKGDGAAIDAKTRELISLAVAAQIPCEYCVYSHTERLKKLGAAESEIKEAVAIAGYIRLFSTIFNGSSSLSMESYKAEFDKALSAN